MGVVYEAEQTEPVHRRVALKVMKAGMDTKEVVARFEAERQALAVMDHPGIAKVLDAGASDVGRPYFVMELVKGIPITEYCDQRTLSVRDRITLFAEVCQAVQHAHQKGIIHRDLKPSNVLVTERDGRPVPKVIDFGIAKAVSQRLTKRTLVTAYGVAMGTPAYMSPEQAEMSHLDVDTRADIYSLGVMLYELLVGELPMDPGQVGMQAFIADLVLGETGHPRPSRRVSTTGDSERLAALRRTDSGGLRKVLQGDLDWIVLKAMEKDRGRRYDTANGLAMDLGRYLRNEPVVARPPTPAYRFRKFARRHRAGVLAGAAVAVALVAGVVLATAGFIRATRAEQVAQREADAAREVSDFLTGLFEQGDPSAAGGRQVTAEEILDRGAARIRADLADRPAVQARLMATMGAAYRGLGRLDVAASLLEQALDLQTTPGADEVEAAHTKILLATVLIDQGAFDRAERLNREALATFHAAYGDAYHEDLVGATTNLAFGLLRENARLTEGEGLLRRILAQQQAAGLEDWTVSNVMDLLCWTLINKGDLDAAREMCLGTLDLRRRLVPTDNLGVAVALQRAGVVNRQQGRLDEALGYYREALAMNTRLYGDVHTETAWNHYDLALTFRAGGNLDSAFVHAAEAVRIRRLVMAEDNPQLAEALFELATVLRQQGNVQRSATVFGEGLAIEERALRNQTGDPASSATAAIRLHARYATLLRLAGRPAEARREDATTLQLLDSAIARGTYGSDSAPLTLNAACWWGSLAGHAERVLGVCDAAVAASDDGNRPRIRDSRGVARALAGDYAGAIADFEAYIARPANVSGVPVRRAWIATLARGENPFTREELDRLILP
jgi:tetratricopeptide (TPR) repeat protein/tRNA A-37 threonylcarbamoyl transferase component Bud32